MIRTLLAAMLLRTLGARVEYRVARVHTDGKRRSDGTVLLRTHKYREALAKYRKARIGDTDTATIMLTATVKQRHGSIEAS